MLKNALLILLLLFSVGLWRWYSVDDTPAEAELIDLSQPDFIATNLYSVNFDEDGKLAFRIFADSMTYHDLDAKTVFEKPVVLVYPEQTRPIWQLSANRGILFARQAAVGSEPTAVDDGEKTQHNETTEPMTVVLEDEVKIINLTNNEYVKQVTTSKIALDLQTQTIHTQAKVFVAGPLYDLEGVGLEGNLKEEQVSLLNEVHGFYHNQTHELD